MKRLVFLLLPFIANASVSPRKKYSIAELHAIKEKMEYEKYLDSLNKPGVKRKRLVKYKPIVAPNNSPEFKSNRFTLPVPEIVIQFEEYKK